MQGYARSAARMGVEIQVCIVCLNGKPNGWGRTGQLEALRSQEVRASNKLLSRA